VIRSRALRTNRFLASEKSGAALVEFSLLLPILFGLTAVCIEFGTAFHQHQIASKGAKSAARYLARVRNTTLCPTPAGDWATNVATARLMAQKGTITATNTDPYLINSWTSPTDTSFVATVDCFSNPKPVNNTDPDQLYRGAEDLARIEVRVNFQYEGIGMLGALGIDPLNIDITHTELYIGG